MLPYVAKSVDGPQKDHKDLGLCTHTEAQLRVIYDVKYIQGTLSVSIGLEKATHEVWTAVPSAGPPNPELRRLDGLSPKSVQSASGKRFKDACIIAPKKSLPPPLG